LLAAQRHRPLRVHVSVDHSPGHVLPPLPKLRKLRLIEQPRRLGWVGNVNALLTTVRTPYFSILAHDDALSPGYAAAAVGALERSPSAVVAHGSVRHFGVREGEIAGTDSITGSPFERAMEFIRRGPHRAELGWRGIVRSALLGKGLRLRTRHSDGQFSNTLWALELLLHGESRAFPDEYYDKYTNPDGLSRVLHARTPDEKSVMLADNVACLADALLAVDLKPGEREQIATAYIEWLLDLQGHWNIVNAERHANGLKYKEVRPILSKFVARTLLHHAEPAPQP
jgi:hypothetical protein